MRSMNRVSNARMFHLGFEAALFHPSEDWSPREAMLWLEGRGVIVMHGQLDLFFNGWDDAVAGDRFRLNGAQRKPVDQ